MSSNELYKILKQKIPSNITINIFKRNIKYFEYMYSNNLKFNLFEYHRKYDNNGVVDYNPLNHIDELLYNFLSHNKLYALMSKFHFDKIFQIKDINFMFDNFTKTEIVSIYSLYFNKTPTSICEICNTEFISEKYKKNKTCSETCRNKQISIRMLNDNPVHKFSEETKKRIAVNGSIRMKRKIANGEFTPCVTNSWSRSKCYMDNIPFRSSWEVMFYSLNKHLKYEVTRVPYIGLDNKIHNYILDFTDEKK